MAFIYKITNNINGKIYIGKTNNSIEERFKEHCSDSSKPRCEKRPLYDAMNKYGIENFSIEEIENCSSDVASEREQYWIAYYRGYEDGYNATRGGDGQPLFDHRAIAEALKEHPYPTDVAKDFGCSPDTARAIAKEYGIAVKSKGVMNVNAPKQIQQFTKDGEYIQTFSSVQKAVEWCVAHQTCGCANSGARSHIAEAANGKRKTAYKYVWRYV